jgi:mono/diheme cytochrome c family protein
MSINKIVKAGLVIVAAVALFSCGTRRSPGRAYMPDMTYSVAYETYAPAQQRLEASAKAKNELSPFYSGMPVPGTIARGEMLPIHMSSNRDSAISAAGIKNPLDVAKVDLKEAERLFLINCAICHGTKLDGNGPLYNGGNGPFAAKPADLVASTMTEGSMFHVATYGKGQMGSYASQLTTTQRWEVIAYIHSKRAGGSTGAPGMSADSAAAASAKPATADSAKAAAPKG